MTNCPWNVSCFSKGTCFVLFKSNPYLLFHFDMKLTCQVVNAMDPKEAVEARDALAVQAREPIAVQAREAEAAKPILH